MYSVIRRRPGVQPCCGIIFALILAVAVGCRPSERKQEPAKTGDAKPPAAAQVVPDQSEPAVPEQSPPATEEPVPEATPPEDAPIEEPAPETTPPEEPAPEAAPTEEAVPESEAGDPNLDVAVRHMPKPVANPNAEAKTEKEMKPYTEKIVGTDAVFDMVPIPGGAYKLGSPDSEEGRNDDEGPQAEVKIEPFWMGKHEVTWNEYELWGLGLDKQRRDAKKDAAPNVWDQTADALAIPTKPYSDMTFGMGKEGYPAICMTQFAAKMYCKWLTAKTGRYYRLPTEAEWEYACRAGTVGPYSFGDDDIDDYAWHADNSDEQYHQVGGKKPNPWGLFDMHGNVAEWCLDEYVADRYTQLQGSPQVNPFTIVTKMYPQVARGGAWTDEPEKLRSAARRGSNPDWKAQDPQIPQSIWYHTDADFVGFRVIRPLRVPTPEEAARYEVTEFEKEEFLDYQEAQAGKM